MGVQWTRWWKKRNKKKINNKERNDMSNSLKNSVFYTLGSSNDLIFNISKDNNIFQQLLSIILQGEYCNN